MDGERPHPARARPGGRIRRGAQHRAPGGRAARGRRDGRAPGRPRHLPLHHRRQFAGRHDRPHGGGEPGRHHGDPPAARARGGGLRRDPCQRERARRRAPRPPHRGRRPRPGDLRALGRRVPSAHLRLLAQRFPQGDPPSGAHLPQPRAVVRHEAAVVLGRAPAALLPRARRHPGRAAAPRRRRRQGGDAGPSPDGGEEFCSAADGVPRPGLQLRAEPLKFRRLFRVPGRSSAW